MERGRRQENGMGRLTVSSGILPTVAEGGVWFATVDGAPRATARSGSLRRDKDGFGDMSSRLTLDLSWGQRVRGRGRGKSCPRFPV